MFLWKKKAEIPLSPTQHAGLQALTDCSADAVKKLAQRKQLLFFTWLTDNYGEEECKRLFGAALLAMDFHRCVDEWGNFSRARGDLLNISIALPDAGKMPAAGCEEEPKMTPSYARYLKEWCDTYPEPK